jgi:hypothetical protein
MYSRASIWIALGGLGLAVTLAAGCEGSSGSKKPVGDAAPPSSGGPDGNLPAPGNGLGGKGGSTDAAPMIEVHPPEAPPPIGPDKLKILDNGATLVGGISVACSYGPASTASKVRWCAFAKPGATLSTLELWVFNMSKLPAKPKCDGSSADCIKLTSNLFGGVPQDGGPQFPSAHRFYGDTLMYYADAKSKPSDTYNGPIYAWQPGWPAGKKISATSDAFQCVGITRASVALCLENVKFDATPITFDLTAGRIDGDKPVQQIANIVPAHPTTMASQWQTTFTSDGKYFLYSAASPGVAGGAQTPETLYYLETDKIGVEPPKKVGEAGISSWDISPDYTKWFYLRDFNYSRTQPSGTLWMADFPSGANPVKLSSTKVSSGNQVGVTDFAMVPTQLPPNSPPGTVPKLAFVNILQKLGMDGKGEVVSIKNPAMSLDDAANVPMVLQSSPGLPFNSPDLRYARYVDGQSMAVQGLTDSHILKYDGSPPCVLTSSLTSSIFGFPFLENAGLTFWVDNYDQNSDTGEGWVGDPKDCTSKKRRFSTAIDYWFVKGDEQLVYTDDVHNDVSTLRIAKIVNGDLGAGEQIQTKIERKAWALLPGQESILFEIKSTNIDVNGIYYYKVGAGGGAGDAGTPPAPADAGAGN